MDSHESEVEPELPRSGKPLHGRERPRIGPVVATVLFVVAVLVIFFLITWLG